MGWKFHVRAAFNLFLLLGICCVGVPLSLLLLAANEVCCWTRRKTSQHASIQQLSPDRAESHKEVTHMAIEPQEVPGAPPETEPVPQSEPDLATFVADLNKLPQKFTLEEAAQLWSIYLRSLDELKRIRNVAGKAGGSEVSE